MTWSTATGELLDSRKKANRVSFGYRFTDGLPIAVHKAFGDFTKAINVQRANFEHSLSFDVASYFNAIYHHALTPWFANLRNVTPEDAGAFGIFMREINSGRSIGFPSAWTLSDEDDRSGFLSFVENSGEIKCATTLRFMDDIYLFDDSLETLVNDFLKIQDLMGGVALNVNAAKTR